MTSQDPELKDGLLLPIWIKGKSTREFDHFAASPPPLEDSFYIRYPKTDVLFGKPQKEGDVTGVSSTKGRDWSSHTKPCQEVLHGIAPINTAVNSVKPKPAGIDDGFKGEGAACGTSIVKVAHQMISSSNRVSQRGFTVASPSDEPEGPDERYRLTRRGSKSLPTTPIHSPPTSPNSRRKYTNRFFTSPFEPSEEGVNNRSWLTTALLGFKKDLTTSTSTLAEEDFLEVRLQGGTLAESVENLGPSPRGKDAKILTEVPTQQPKLAKPAPTFRPKPTELREMNFWSPTSM